MRKRPLLFVVALTAAIVAAAGAAMGSAGATSAEDGNQIAGTWLVSVNRPAPLPPLKSLQVFTDDGSIVEMASEWQAERSASYGSWERVDGHLYAATMVFFRFNPQTGQYIGTRKIDRNVRLAQDGQSFAHVAKVTTFDVDGNVLGSFTVRATGERVQVDRIADEP
jgi:hypothetical protein